MKKTEKLIDREQKDRRDTDRNGIDDRFEPPVPDIGAGSHQLAERLRENHGMDPSLSGGDVDASWEMAESQGDEAATGSQSTPGQNNTDEIGEAMGITYADDEELKLGEKEQERDKHRWELDPASSDDYKERLKDQG